MNTESLHSDKDAIELADIHLNPCTRKTKF
jgi:hypothetical protein